MTKNLKAIVDFERKRFTQQNIADKLGISRSYVAQLLSGKRKNPKMLSKIQELLKKEGLI